MNNFLDKLHLFWLSVWHKPFAAGLRAEKLFEKQAADNGWIIEKINQDKKSFEAYKNVASTSVKRADYICVNLPEKVDIEVKCFTPCGNNDAKYFFLHYSHYKRHQITTEEITKSRILFAFYQRLGSNAISDSLCMIDIKDIPKVSEYDENRKGWKIPLKATKPSFEKLQEIKGSEK